jgi:hypothetical protein
VPAPSAICRMKTEHARFKRVKPMKRLSCRSNLFLMVTQFMLLLSLEGVCNLKLVVKNGVIWDVTPCGSCKNRRNGGTWRIHTLMREGLSSSKTSVLTRATRRNIQR